MLSSRYDLFIGIGIGAAAVIIFVLVATFLFCKCCIPSPNHRYFGRTTSHYAAINSIDAKTYFKPPQHLSYVPTVHRNPQPPVITQEASSQSARTSVASGGRLSILSEKLSRLSISSNHSARASVASDSVLLHKKCDAGRLSHSYEDTDTQAISAHYASRRNSKLPRLSATDIENPLNNLSNANSSKNIRFQLYPRSSDAIERSISSVDQSAGVIQEETINGSRRASAKSIETNQNSGRRQSLFRSPSSRPAIPKFPAVGKHSITFTRSSISTNEQGLLSPPISPPGSLLYHKTKTLRGALGAIMPDMYFIENSNSKNHQVEEKLNANSVSTGPGESNNEEIVQVEDHAHKLRVRVQFDEHRNDLIVNVVEAQGLPRERDEITNPYVKIYLRPPIDQKLRQTSVQPQTINPIWDEYFKFGVSNGSGFKTTRVLQFYIYNYAHSSRPECIGEAEIRLTPQTIHNVGDAWCYITKKRAEDEYLGELLISLTYLAQAERLNVGIIEARNLKALSMNLEADPLVRLTLQLGQTDKVKRKKTSVKRNTLNPKWNEEISFNVSGISLADSVLEIGVYHHDLIAPDEPLGFLRFENTTSISSSNIAQHSEIIHWCEVINGEQRAACWHLLRKAAKIKTSIDSNMKSSSPLTKAKTSNSVAK